jgi:tetratricopeptide (TPR) repeat protein
MKKVLQIFVFLALPVCLLSQNSSATDSLLSLIKAEKNDSLKAEHYFRLGFMYNMASSLEAKINAHSIAQTLFHDQPISDHKLRNLSELGRCYLEKGDYRTSEKMYNKAIDEAKESDSLELEFSATVKYLDAFLSLKSPVKGLETVLELTKKANAANKKELLFQCYQLKNTHYLVSGIKLEERRALADTMLMIAEELQDSFLIQRAYFELAGTTYDERSIEYYKKSLSYVSPNDRYSLSSLYNNLSGRYSFLRNFDQALIYADSAYNVSVEVNRKVGVAASLYRKGEAYFFKNEFEKAVDYGMQALETFKDADVLRRQDMCAEMISEAYKRLGLYEESLEFKELQFQLRDSLKRRNELEDLQFVEQRFEYELNQKQDSTNLAMQQVKIKSMNAVK